MLEVAGQVRGRTRHDRVLIFLCPLLAASGLHAQGPRKETVMIPMRDDTKLATNLYFPATGEGPWPVLLVRTPYNKDLIGGPLAAAPVVGQGIVYACQDMRGRFASEGLSRVFRDDGWGVRQDGYDTVEWLAAQKWCNGKVGTEGGSAMGIVQYMMAGAAPPHYVCGRAVVATPDLPNHAAFQGGGFRKELVENWLAMCKFPEVNLQDLTNAQALTDKTQPASLVGQWDRCHTPIYHVGGWYDIFLQGTLDAFAGMQEHGGKGARGQQRLIMGPWTHGGMGRRKQGELTYPENCSPPKSAMLNEWLVHFLLCRFDQVVTDPPVLYYRMGDVDDPKAPGNDWITSATWPPKAETLRLYLRTSNALSKEPPPKEEPSSFQYDPVSPVPTVGGANLTIPAGPMDQRKVESRPDVLIYSTAPLDKPMEVTGRLTAHLWIASSAKDTDFTAKLTDVYPDGRSMLVLDGIARARYREGLLRSKLLTPTKAYELDVDLWSTSIVFNKGHQIRLAVSSSNSPRFDPSPNNGGPLRPWKDPVVATNTVYHDAQRPSYLALPTRQVEQVGR